MFGGDSDDDEQPRDDSGDLIVEVYAGRNITFGNTRASKTGPKICNPFCVLQLGKLKCQTEVMVSTMDPLWQARFQFPLEGLRESAALLVTCYHETPLKMKDMIGEIRLPISEHRNVSFEHAVQHWYPLYNASMKKKDGSCGEIGIKIGAKRTLAGATKLNEYTTDYDSRTADDLYREANILAIEANQSAHRSLNMLEATRESGSATLSKMKEQGALIERGNLDLDSINSHMEYNDRKLRSMESVWGTLANKITAGDAGVTKNRKRVEGEKKVIKNRKKDDKALQKMKETQWQARRDADKANSICNDAMLRRHGGTRVGHNRPGEYGQAINNDEENFYTTLEDTDKTVDQIGYVLDDLKFIAIEIGNEVHEQQERLMMLHDQMGTASKKISRAANRTNALAND